MRLTCPNCAAQYEVDDSVVPRGGRDVQCSACGHTWYQYPREVALEMRAAELDDDDDDDADTGSAPPPLRGAGAASRIDKTVLDVLREEAEREMSERRRDRSTVESQGDLGLTRPTRSKAAPSRIHGEDDPATQAPPPEVPEDDRHREAPRRRRMLPDIEELSSTLEPGGNAGAADPSANEAPAGDARGMRRGLTLVALIAAGFVALYQLAPLIADWLPASAGMLTVYVDTINGLRGAVSGLLRSLMGG